MNTNTKPELFHLTLKKLSDGSIEDVLTSKPIGYDECLAMMSKQSDITRRSEKFYLYIMPDYEYRKIISGETLSDLDLAYFEELALLYPEINGDCDDAMVIALDK